MIYNENVKEMNMSNVLVIHPQDSSTEMLKAVYEGKGYDVINDGCIAQEDLVRAIEEHDTIIMLGHGTPYGLLAVDGHSRFVGYLIDDSHADLLKTKKTYSMWCYSDVYFRRHGMKGFHSGMIISEQSEAMMFGEHKYSDEDIAKSLMPLMYAMHDTLEMEDLEEMRRIILERYDADDFVTQFNRENILIL
jgi:hypothetical protein